MWNLAITEQIRACVVSYTIIMLLILYESVAQYFNCNKLKVWNFLFLLLSRITAADAFAQNVCLDIFVAWLSIVYFRKGKRSILIMYIQTA